MSGSQQQSSQQQQQQQQPAELLASIENAAGRVGCRVVSLFADCWLLNESVHELTYEFEDGSRVASKTRRIQMEGQSNLVRLILSSLASCVDVDALLVCAELFLDRSHAMRAD